MFKIGWAPRRPWRTYCDLQHCPGALRDLTMTQRQSGAICEILHIAPMSASCMTINILFRLTTWESSMANFNSFAEKAKNWSMLFCNPLWKWSHWLHSQTPHEFRNLSNMIEDRWLTLRRELHHLQTGDNYYSTYMYEHSQGRRFVKDQ